MVTRKSERMKERKENMRGGEGVVELTPFSRELPHNARLFSEIRVKPGSSIGYHVHEGETEIFYFISGQGRVRDDDKVVDVSAGDSMATFSGHGHSVMCTGDEDLVMAAVIILE